MEQTTVQLWESLGQPSRELCCRAGLLGSLYWPGTENLLITAVLSPGLALPAKWVASAWKLRQILWTVAAGSGQLPALLCRVSLEGRSE